MSHILPGHNGLKNTVPVWIEPVSSYSLTGSCASQPRQGIAARGPSRHGQRLGQPQPARRCCSRPSVRCSGSSCCSQVSCSAPRGARGDRGDRGARLHGGLRRQPGRGWELPLESQPCSSGVAQPGCRDKRGFVRCAGLVWHCWNTEICLQVNERSVSAEAFGVSDFCQIRGEVECFNVQDIVFLKNSFYFHFLLSLISMQSPCARLVQSTSRPCCNNSAALG